MPTVTIDNPYLEGWNQGQYRTGLLQGDPSGQVIQQQIAGQISPDVLAGIYQRGAERGISTGMPGSANAGAATMRALGLTSLDIQNQGMANLFKLYGMPRGTAPGSAATTVDTGPRDTAYPMGSAPRGGASAADSNAYAGAIKAPVDPAAPGGGYDTWLAQWQKAYGIGGTGGGIKPATTSPAGDGSDLVPTDQYLESLGQQYDDLTGANIDYGDPNWWYNIVQPEGTQNLQGSSTYDPFAASEYYLGE